MRKIFEAARKAEIIERAYWRGPEYGEVAEHLLDPARVNQADISPEDTIAEMADRMSHGRLPNMKLAFVESNLLSLPPSTEARAVSLITLLEHGFTFTGIRARQADWHLN